MIIRTLFFSLVPGLVALGWAYACYAKAYFLYPFLAWHKTNVGQFYLPAAIAALGIVLLINLMVRLKRKYPDGADDISAIFKYGLIPFGGIFLFVNWISTLLITLAVVIIAMSIKAMLRPLVTKAGKKTDSLAVTLIFVYLCALLIIFFAYVGGLWITANKWGYTVRNVVDMRQNKILRDFDDLEALGGNNRVEYAKITNPDLALQMKQTKKFGMGESAYRLTYALLFDQKNPPTDPSTRRFWYFCDNGDCELKNPLYVTIDRCNEGTCPEDFFKVLGYILEKHPGERPRAHPSPMLLSPAPELGFTSEMWRDKIAERLLEVLITQFCFTLGCVALAFVLRKTR